MIHHLLSPFRPFALSPFCPFALSPFRPFALSPFRPFALSPFRPFACVICMCWRDSIGSKCVWVTLHCPDSEWPPPTPVRPSCMTRFGWTLFFGPGSGSGARLPLRCGLPFSLLTLSPEVLASPVVPTMTADGSLGKLFPVKSDIPPQSARRNSLTPESRFWRSFKSDQVAAHVSSITSIEFSPSPPHDFAFSSSASVSIYDSKLCSSKATITSFNDIAYSPSFRSDGRLLAAGSHSGVVQVFDPQTRVPLRRMQAHTSSSRVVRFPRTDKLHLFSAADDALLNYWDVASPDTPLLTIRAHKDYVRAGCPSPASNELFATGSYDHFVSLWDVRNSSSAPILSLNHNKPVECVLFLPSGGLLASAGGNVVKIWDVISGGKLLHTIESHNKTVTSMCLAKIPGPSDLQRLLTVSLDGYMKVFDFSSFKIIHSMRFPAPLLSIGYSPTCSTRVIGTSNGILFLGKRKQLQDSQTKVDEKLSVGKPKRVLRPSNYRYFQRGQSEKPSEGDVLLRRPRKLKLAEHDKLLRKFRHRDALVSALNDKNPRNIVAVMEELVARKKLLKCVANLDNNELGLLLGFLHRYTTMPRYANFLMGLARKVLVMRAKNISESTELQKHVRNLKRMVMEEIKIQTSLLEIQGIISPLLRIAGR
ncbi:hypothetical protein H6P81_006265 [Aristolochia fimbriata]|uniref:U3 small nucleolar RNA-associated protein 15 C-terminal domain-containing protein n=1 Tax=Aristolochia fimbriata TaxID=158543 RepID=A0AAV7F0J1_ARIFI|nr:hypothetical protein H6P81_006265 [Aristolochia fimbriata]